jgi:hypothetical protein
LGYWKKPKIERDESEGHEWGKDGGEREGKGDIERRRVIYI